MRRQIKGVKPRRKKNRKHRKKNALTKLTIIIILITVIFILLYEYIDRQIMPSVIAMSEMKIKTISTTIINEAVNKTLQEANINTDDLVTYYFDNNGDIASCGIDTITINQICADVINNISSSVDTYQEASIPIPIGNVVGTSILANLGPSIAVEVMPYGTATINYDREFRSTGINQINHRIWLTIETTMQIVVPLATEKVNVVQHVTLVDRILSGDVPPNYVNVPENNILDVAPMEGNDVNRK